MASPEITNLWPHSLWIDMIGLDDHLIIHTFKWIINDHVWAKTILSRTWAHNLWAQLKIIHKQVLKIPFLLYISLLWPLEGFQNFFLFFSVKKKISQKPTSTHRWNLSTMNPSHFSDCDTGYPTHPFVLKTHQIEKKKWKLKIEKDPTQSSLLFCGQKLLYPTSCPFRAVQYPRAPPKRLQYWLWVLTNFLNTHIKKLYKEGVVIFLQHLIFDLWGLNQDLGKFLNTWFWKFMLWKVLAALIKGIKGKEIEFCPTNKVVGCEGWFLRLQASKGHQFSLEMVRIVQSTCQQSLTGVVTFSKGWRKNCVCRKKLEW